jgi:cytochrome c556
MAVLISVVVIALGVVAATFGAYELYAYFAPKYEAVRREVMTESRYYNEASIRELYRLKRQYDAAKTEEEKATIVAAARHEFSIYPEDRLPPDLHGWMVAIK